MVMSSSGGMCDAAIREQLPRLWRLIEDAMFSYLEMDDSPDKLQQKNKLDGYITEFLSIVPPQYKYGMKETSKVFQKTINELPDFSAYKLATGWAAVGKYAENLLQQPWRKDFKTIRLYSGYYKHEVEVNLVGAESILCAMGYKFSGAASLTLEEAVCPDTVAAVARDAAIAAQEARLMCSIWEGAWATGVRVTWTDIALNRATSSGDVETALAILDGRAPDSEIYANLPPTITSDPHSYNRIVEPRFPPIRSHAPLQHCKHAIDETQMEEPITPIVNPYLVQQMPMMYQLPHMHEMPMSVPQCNAVPMMTPYGVPCYFPVQAPYMIPTPVYAPIKQANNVSMNGYPSIPHYNYPSVPTGQLIELDPSAAYENGKFITMEDHKRHKLESSRRNSTSKSGFSDVTLPSLPRSDTQPSLSKAREDGMGTYESWDYVFRNLSNKEQVNGRSKYSPSYDRDSRTLDRLYREERRSKYQPTTLDLEDGLIAMNLDRSFDEDAYRTAKVNESLMRLKQDQESKRSRHVAKRQPSEERKFKKPLEVVANPSSDALITNKTAPDKVKLLSKQDVKDRKDVIKQQNSMNGHSSNLDVRKIKKLSLNNKSTESERPKAAKPSKLVENGVNSAAHSSKTNGATSSTKQIHDLKAQLIVALDETDSIRQSPSRTSHYSERGKTNTNQTEQRRGGDRWECGTCTYINKSGLVACEMCGKSKKGPEIQPLTSGGKECPACTLVNARESITCDACGTSLEHCPTYI